MGGGGGGWIEMCVLTRRRPGYMVMDLDLEEMTVRKEKPRIDSATGKSTVENTDMLELGFNLSWHNKGRKQEKATRSSAREAQGRAEQHQLADVYSVVGARVIAHAGMTQDREEKKKQC
jgi:hypothetical protein